eukprot:GHVS01002197.1.p1 GENE.GHVS01002197.1~~GHVS01002197.1.p1  ORF type:complete len:424 (-),score=36.96 GHVS01002197.1:791-2062(-)
MYHLIKTDKQVGMIWGTGSMLVMLYNGHFQAVVKDDFTEEARKFLRIGDAYIAPNLRHFWLRGELEENDLNRLLLGLNGSLVMVDENEQITKAINDLKDKDTATFHKTVMPTPDAKEAGMKEVEIVKESDIPIKVKVEKPLANDDAWNTLMRESFGVDNYGILKEHTKTKKGQCLVLVAKPGLAVLKDKDEYRLFRTKNYSLGNKIMSDNEKLLVDAIDNDAKDGKILFYPGVSESELYMCAFHLAELMPQGRGVVSEIVTRGIRGIDATMHPSLAPFRGKFVMKAKHLPTKEITIDILDEKPRHAANMNVWETLRDTTLTLQVLSGMEPVELKVDSGSDMLTVSPSSQEKQSFCIVHDNRIEGGRAYTVFMFLDHLHDKAKSRCVKIGKLKLRCAPIDDLEKDIKFLDDEGHIVELDINIRA